MFHHLSGLQPDSGATLAHGSGTRSCAAASSGHAGGQVREADAEAVAMLGLDTFPSLVVLPSDTGGVIKYTGAPALSWQQHVIWGGP